MSLLDSVLSADRTRQDVGIAVLKKAQDVSKQQAEALLQGIEESGPQGEGSTLDVYA